MDDKPIITEVDVVPFDAIVNVPISGRFYERMQNLLLSLINNSKEEPEAIVLIFKELETREPQNLWEEEVVVLTSLIYGLDTAAANAGQTIKEPISKFVPTDSSPEASLEN